MTDNRSYPRFDEHYPDGPFDLGTVLAMFRAGRDAAVGVKVGQRMDQATKELAAQGLIDGVPSVGDPAPLFTLPNAIGSEVSLERLLADGPVVLSFYRGVWCPYCNLEQRAVQQHLTDLPEYLRESYQKMGHSLPPFNGTDDWTLPIPATFVVDRAGVVRFRFADPDYSRRAAPSDILAALRSIA